MALKPNLMADPTLMRPLPPPMPRPDHGSLLGGSRELPTPCASATTTSFKRLPPASAPFRSFPPHCSRYRPMRQIPTRPANSTANVFFSLPNSLATQCNFLYQQPLLSARWRSPSVAPMSLRLIEPLFSRFILCVIRHMEEKRAMYKKLKSGPK